MPRIITSSRLRRYSKIGVRGDPSRVQTTAQGMRPIPSLKAMRSRFITIIRGYKPLLQFSWIQMTTYPPQLGIQYPVGFENGLNIDEFEGIRPDYRGAFRWYSNNLYYRYAKDGEFGVARVNTGGTTTKMIGQAVGKSQNHLNFAFDITSTGTIYFVYAIDDANSSTLTIKRRTSGGTESTILTDIRGLAAFSDIHSEFGAYLGAHEVLFHNNQLYILAPMQSADFGEDATDTQADPDFIIEIADTGMSGERNVTTSTNLNPTSTRSHPVTTSRSV